MIKNTRIVLGTEKRGRTLSWSCHSVSSAFFRAKKNFATRIALGTEKRGRTLSWSCYSVSSTFFRAKKKNVVPCCSSCLPSKSNLAANYGALQKIFQKKIGGVAKKHYLCTRIREGFSLDTKIGRWCNGNTTGFGSVIPGSNPSRPTSAKPLLHHCCRGFLT